MATTSNNALNHQNHCTICLEGLAVRTTVTLRCRHTFHLDCLGSAFNAGNAMRCPVCRAVEEGVWRIFPTRAPRRSRAGARVIQETAQEPPVQMDGVEEGWGFSNKEKDPMASKDLNEEPYERPPSEIYWGLDQGWFSGSLSLGNGGPIRHPYLFQHRRRETAHMMMGSVNGSGGHASASSHVTRITHLRLGINRRPNYGYSFQGNAGPNEHYDPYPQGMNSFQPVGVEEPGVALLGEPIFNYRASAGSSFGRLAGAAPMEHSMNLPSQPVRAMMRAANNRSSSSGLLPAEQMTFQAERSGTVNIQLPNGGEVVLALSADVQRGDGMEGSEDIMADGEESVEDLSQ